MYTLFSNKKNKTCPHPKLNNTPINRVPAVKYLGVYIDEQLSWKPHIEHIGRKLTQLKGAFFHLSKFLPKQLIPQVYHAYVFPHIKYGIELYGTCCKTRLKTIEVQQSKLLKILMNVPYRYSTTAMYQELKLLTVKSIHDLFSDIFVFKQRNNLLPSIFQNYYYTKRELGIRSTKHIDDLSLPIFKLKSTDKSMKYNGAKLWNTLPTNIQHSKSVDIFKLETKKYLFAKQSQEKS